MFFIILGHLLYYFKNLISEDFYLIYMDPNGSHTQNSQRGFSDLSFGVLSQVGAARRKVFPSLALCGYPRDE